MFVRFQSFRFRWKSGARLAREVRFSDFGNKKKLAVQLFATNAPNPPLFTQNSCLLRFVVPVFDGTTSRNSPGRSVLATFRTKKLAVELFATNAPNPPLLNQNSCLLRFRSFGFRRMNDAKLAREVRFGDFWNKKTCS